MAPRQHRGGLVEAGVSRRWPTLAQRFDPRRNSLNALRLALATSVIVSHSWPLSGSGGTPAVGNQFLGDIAVDGFFAVSGFLILGSRLNSRSLVDFFWRRFLRIWPAFVVVLLFVAFLVAPVAALALGSGTYDPLSAVGYVLKNLGLVIVQPGIESTPVGIPETGTWNAPLWTLAYEFSCYIAIALVVTVVPRQMLGGAIAALVSAALIVGQAFDVVGALPFAYLMLYLGVVLPLVRVGAVNDISYGMYIYAFPLQLVLAVIVGETLPAWAFVLVSVAITVPFAAASWFLVENPVMRLKRLTGGQPVATR